VELSSVVQWRVEYIVWASIADGRSCKPLPIIWTAKLAMRARSSLTTVAASIVKVLSSQE
jgi:hypothetical protein